MYRIGTLGELGELATLLGPDEPPYLRFSAGPEADAAESSVDGESGCVLPGLSVNPLRPEPWWTRPAVQWLARQVRQYAHLGDGTSYAWVLTGEVVGHGPDCEPLVAGVRPVATLDDAVLEEAANVYRASFDVGARPGTDR